MAQRSGDFAGGMLSIPGPMPRAESLFKVGNDTVGDAAIDVGFGLTHGPSPLLIAKQRRLLPGAA